MVVERRCVSVLVDTIVSLEKSITKVAIDSALNDTYEVAKLLLEKIKQKDELIAQLKTIKKFISKLPEQDKKIFILYFTRA